MVRKSYGQNQGDENKDCVDDCEGDHPAHDRVSVVVRVVRHSVLGFWSYVSRALQNLAVLIGTFSTHWRRWKMACRASF